MKRIIYLIVFLTFLVIPLQFQSMAILQDIWIDSKISQVYVYPQSAMIVREGKVELDQGRYRVIFDNILEVFDEKTINVETLQTGKENAKVTGVSIETEILSEEPEEKIRQLQNEISNLERENKRITNEKSGLSDKKEFLNSIIYLFQDQRMYGNSGNTSTLIPSTEQLEDIYTFLNDKLKENYNQTLICDFELETNQAKIDYLQKQILLISDSQRETKKVISVDLEVLRKSNFSIILSYFISGEVSWEPVYDARIDISENRIDFITYALVRQATGTDWKDVSLFLSTARPTISGQLPPIVPWILRPYQPDQRIGQKMEAPMAFREDTDAVSMSAVAEQEFSVPVEYGGTSVTFNIPEKTSIYSGSKQEKILISEQEMSGAFNYKTFPRGNPFVYFNTFLENDLAIPLLPGQVNIFLDSGFTGDTAIGYIPPGEDFDLSLGIAENVKVKRELLKKFRDQTVIANIPSLKITTKYEYKITVENFQDMNSFIEIFETVPISEDDRIQINIDQVTPEPKVKDWNDKKGVWMWEYLLEPHDKIEIGIVYSVIHPRDMQIVGLVD
ncbi:MAG: mucoidy inhibitor MuiA family protein [Atribacterota bacterium]|nr:mucoidy inhibitor MuiA family protein [Atribacterota bacterium]MDD4896191.1 mucoidy inhibitor MuiA family protein [Atribacterota bacterium]MDD5637946.1 mucoidy inhibitor MuiA family protein [Atribacterota bacterium]